MKYPQHEVYEALYAKYLDPESLKALMDLAGVDLENKLVLDLCCGTGVCTDEALKRNASYITMIDEEKRMIPDRFSRDGRINIRVDSVGSSLYHYGLCGNKWDVVVCRQAINYWFDKIFIESLSKVMSSGGVFVFNTFNTKPSASPKIKQYYHKNILFTEISYSTGEDKIHHVQIREGYPPHMANFKWVSPETFDSVLGEYFNIEKVTKNKTDYYRCVKK